MMVGVGLYVKNSAEAVQLYQEVFGLELGYNVKNPDGSFYHSELCRDGHEVLSVVERRESSAQESRVQLGIEMEDEAAVRRAFDLLKEGGTVDMPVRELPWSPCAASVIDRFGVWWYLAARSHRPDDSFDPTVPL